MKTFKLCTLDVWGNENDGYEINDWFTWRAEVPVEELENMDEFLRAHLKGEPDQYEVRDEQNGFIEISHKATGEPILHLTENYEA